MATLTQNIRYKKPDPSDPANPQGVFSYLLQPKQLAGLGAPSDDLGADENLYMDTATGSQYVKQNGTWGLFLDWATLPVGTGMGPDINVDSISPVSNDILIQTTGVLTLNSPSTLLSGDTCDIGSINNSVRGSINGSITDTAQTGWTAQTNTGAITLAGDQLNMSADGLIPSFLQATVGGVVIQGKDACSLAMSGTDVRIDAGPAGKIIINSGQGVEFNNQFLTGIGAINGSDAITTYKNLGVNPLSQLGYLEPPDSIQAVVPNITAVAGDQFWQSGVGTSPADFLTVGLPTPAGQNRKLVGVEAHFLHNDAAWQILAGVVNIVVGYVAAGQATSIANLQILWTSPAFPVGVSYPDINDPAITTPAALPIGAKVVAIIRKSAGVSLSANLADLSINLKFL